MTGAIIEVRIAGHVLRRVRLGDAPVLVGSSPGCAVSLRDALVADEQLELRLDAMGLVVVQLRSAAPPVMLNGKPLGLGLPVQLMPGDSLGVGAHELRLADGAAHREAAPVARRDATAEHGWEPPLPVAPSAYLEFLPPIYDQEALGRLLCIFEAVFEPLEEQRTQLRHYFDGHTSPDAVRQWMTSWAHAPGLERVASIEEAAGLRWRGTREGDEVAHLPRPAKTDQGGE